MMKKRFLGITMAALLAFSCSSFVMAEEAPDCSGDPEVTLVYAEVNPLDTTVVGQVAMHFAERINELTSGTVTIDIQGGGVLGAEGDYCDDMIGGIGTIDMARLSVSTLTGYGVPKSALLCLPFTFTSRDHFWNFAASDLAQEFMDEPEENGLGLRGLFLGEEGFRHIFCNKEVSSLDDLQGLKIRVSTDPTMMAMINAFGANATAIPYGELYQSLQSGVVDGA